MTTPRNRGIDAATRASIGASLDAIERDRGVRILLAVESGSRAWGFPSQDSDYDVRFLYVRPLAAYLSVAPQRDVIERPLAGALDIGGWDLRKALQLLVSSNAIVLEWLGSPVRYREAGDAAAHMLALATATCDLEALAYHYDRLARRSFDEIATATDPVRIKAYCYALRPALALSWIRRGAVPPMDLPRLLDGAPVAGAVRQETRNLLARKAAATEKDTMERMPALDGFIAAALAKRPLRPQQRDRSAVLAQADALFVSILGIHVDSPTRDQRTCSSR